ncbi:AfsR family transcriptional regulator, partial [Streptomyces sp. AcH 505]
PRQQTLRAVVDWSWDLLDERERTVLRQVSVFAGGWDLTAAESVCGSADAEAAPGAVSAAVAAAPGSVTAASTVDVPGLLGALVDKSLVVAAPVDAPAGGPGGEMRYRLLETIHEYAVERAAETPAVRAAAERLHTAYFTGLAEEAEPLLRSGEQLPWIRRLEADLDNIRAALHRTVTVTGDEDTALRIIFAVGWFWWLRNYRPEGLAWVERALKLGPDTTDPDDPRYWPRMHLLMMRLLLVVESDGTDKVRADPSFDGHVRRVTEAFSKPGPQGARFPGLLWGIVGHFHDETMDMRTQMDASLANCRVYGGDWEVAVLLMGRTHVLVDAPGGMADVDEGLAELHQLTGRVGDRWVRAQVASAVAEAAMARGQYDAAEESYRQALRFAREVGAHAEAPFLLARLAELAFRAGDTATAARGLDEAWAEAERHDVQDTRAFVLVMRAVIALDGSEYARAREALDGAYRAAERGTPPPQFQLVLDGVQARISAHEAAGPAAAVRSLAAVLRRAMGSGLATGIVGSWAEMSAPVLLLAGRSADAVRVLAAVEAQAGDVPRSAPEKRAAEQVEAEARAELGPARFAAERAAGSGLTFEQIAELLEAPADRSSGASVSGS